MISKGRLFEEIHSKVKADNNEQLDSITNQEKSYSRCNQAKNKRFFLYLPYDYRHNWTSRIVITITKL